MLTKLYEIDLAVLDKKILKYHQWIFTVVYFISHCMGKDIMALHLNKLNPLNQRIYF